MTTEIISSYIKNFPFPTFRENQEDVLRQIEEAFNSGYRYIILEAPTGFGKSPVAIAVALTLGTSYICTSTKDLQAQYTRDFPFIKVAKGKNNFICAVKEDFIKNGTYKCQCQQSQSWKCYHTTANYGPCINNTSFQYDRDSKCHGCKYRTTRDNYGIKNKGTIEEEVFLDNDTIDRYRSSYSKWSYLQTSGLKEELKIWRPCEYYHQLNIASEASHSILNYPMFLALLMTERHTPTLLPRKLLILDEAHRLEEEMVKFVGLSISDKLKSPDFDFKIPDYGYGDMDKWLSFLIELKEKLATLLRSQKILAEHVGEVGLYIIKLGWAIENITKDPTNWVISDIKKKEKDKDLYRYYNSEQKEEIIKVELKPLDVSPYCKSIFSKCDKTLMMSATILDKETFCTSIGLPSKEVKFIQVGSDFPLKHRLIRPLNICKLNNYTLNDDEVKRKIATTIDKLMTFHKDQKGIIHTTSYTQLNFIKQNISESNRRRLLETNPDVERNDIVEEHFNTSRVTVLISPSLHLGIDLKDDLSRFQIITKVPYPNIGDKWIDGKRKRNERWYTWQTALRLIQTAGRSIRSKEDWAVTWVLDANFGYFVSRNKDILPTWFLDSIKQFN